MGLVGRLTMAMGAGVSAFRRAFTDPNEQAGRLADSAERYRYLWGLYGNTLYDDLQLVSYRQRNGLYRRIRGLYNPTRRVCDFYAAMVYPGVLQSLKIETENDALNAAVRQVWQWSNWQRGKALIARFGAIAGDALAVVVDDQASGKVRLEVVWPGQITDLSLDAYGNVQRYRREHNAVDDLGRSYQYAKVVDKESIRTYRNNVPTGLNGLPAEYPNPYGFVPAVWCRHRDLGGDHGEPAVGGVTGKIDEINELASILHDRMTAIARSPLIIKSDASMKAILRPNGTATGADEFTPVDRESIRTLRMPVGSGVEMLPLDFGQMLTAMDRMTTEIEADLPELALFRELRGMSQLTGPAARRLMADVEGRVQDAAAGYDEQCVKLFQMAVAIGGWRLADGAWTGKTAQQAKFAGFGLESYQKGDLDMSLAPRSLLTETRREELEEALLAEQVGISRAEVLKDLGYSEERIAEMQAEKADEAGSAGAALLGGFDRGA